MMRFACFSAAAVADEAEAGAQARHRSSGRRRRSSTSSLRNISELFGGGSSKKGGGSGKKHSSSSMLSSSSTTTRHHDDDVYDVVPFGESPPWSSSSLTAAAALSSAVSLDSACSLSSTSTTMTTTSCSGSASPSFLSALSRARRPERRSPAAGVAAVILCLVMVMLCGRVGATVLASAAFYIFPRRWPLTAVSETAAAASPEHDLPAATKETMKRKVVKEGFLVRNRKK